MPYKSKAQQRFFHAAEQRGQMKHSMVKEFDSATKGKFGGLPMHAKHRASGGYAHGDEVVLPEHGTEEGGTMDKHCPTCMCGGGATKMARGGEVADEAGLDPMVTSRLAAQEMQHNRGSTFESDPNSFGRALMRRRLMNGVV